MLGAWGLGQGLGDWARGLRIVVIYLRHAATRGKSPILVHASRRDARQTPRQIMKKHLVLYRVEITFVIFCLEVVNDKLGSAVSCKMVSQVFANHKKLFYLFMFLKLPNT